MSQKYAHIFLASLIDKICAYFLLTQYIVLGILYVGWTTVRGPVSVVLQSVHPFLYNLLLFSLWVELKHGSRVDKSWPLRKKAIKQRSEAYLAFQWSPQTIIQTCIMLIMHSYTLPLYPAS